MILLKKICLFDILENIKRAMPEEKNEKTKNKTCTDKRKNTIKLLGGHFTTISFHPPLQRGFIQHNLILSSSPSRRILPSAVQTFLKPCLLRASFNISTLFCVRVSVSEMFEPLKVFLLEKILLFML